MPIEKKEIALPLNDIRHLLIDPDCDPFEDINLTTSGLDYAIKQLRMKPLPEKIQLNITLPENRRDIDVAYVKNALRRHCLNIVKEREEESCYLNWQIKRNFKRAIFPFLFASIALGFIMYYMMDERSKPMQALLIFLNNCVVILGWVLLWIPTEMYLYDSPRVKREIALYQLFADADIQVKN